MKKINEKYYIDSDSCNLILCERKIRQEGTNKGNEYFDTIGYYGTLEQLQKAIIEREIKSDLNILDNIDQIVKLMDELRGVE